MSATVLGPRLVIAGTHSDVGKTTVATGLMAALRASGHRVSAAKVGPDFIDPGYHSLASGRPGRNLDPWLCGAEAIVPLAGRAAADSDVLIVEGVMGLFDGAADGTASSTAAVARLLEAPVVLVVDAAKMSNSVAALVHGYASFDPEVTLAGVILNRVGSETHATLLREALAGIDVAVLGVLRRDDRFGWRDRHLGLIPVAEQPSRVRHSIDRLSAAITGQVDLASVMATARRAPARPTVAPPLPAAQLPTRIGVAAGPAFSFTYADSLDALSAGGAEVVTFDPLSAVALPEGLDGLIIGGGFPEIYASQLNANQPLLAELASRVNAGLPTWAECGGLLLLCRSLDGHPMAGVLPAVATLGTRLTLGYRTGVTTIATPVGPAGTALRGHEFHYSTVDPAGGAIDLSSRWGRRSDGWGTSTLLATYLHFHPGGNPEPISSFLRSCVAASRPGGPGMKTRRP
jgi:cobyrinic acid a,c-diamide synthase